MNEYIERLERIGIPAHRSYQIVYDFLKVFSNVELEEYITELEHETYVGRV